MARIIVGQGWYLITYGLGIYILNLFLAFLTPKVDPVTMQNEDDDDGGLPTSNQEEFRPFIRRLPEFKFWYSMTKVSWRIPEQSNPMKQQDWIFGSNSNIKGTSTRPTIDT